MRVLELFCGVGGLAEALEPGCEILAVDQSPLAATVYRDNHDHGLLERNVESLDTECLKGFHADLWWASPPCQPYTSKGKRRQLADPRAEGFRAVLGHLERARPTYFAMENVTGFAGSEGEILMREVLARAGYAHRWSRILCPTGFGIPNRRPRYYLVAGRKPLARFREPELAPRFLPTYLERNEPDARYDVPEELVSRFSAAMHLIDTDDASEVANCFASGYGRSIVRCGSYLRRSDGRVRRFTPRETARLLGFPEQFILPDTLTDRNLWKLLGNSLSVPAVQAVLTVIPMP